LQQTLSDFNLPGCHQWQPGFFIGLRLVATSEEAEARQEFAHSV
jgi:hypothetical protein